MSMIQTPTKKVEIGSLGKWGINVQEHVGKYFFALLESSLCAGSSVVDLQTYDGLHLRIKNTLLI